MPIYMGYMFVKKSGFWIQSFEWNLLPHRRNHGNTTSNLRRASKVIWSCFPWIPLLSNVMVLLRCLWRQCPVLRSLLPCCMKIISVPETSVSSTLITPKGNSDGSVDSNMSSKNVDTFLQTRHERAMVRLCALLWILKLEEDKLRRYEAPSTSQQGQAGSQVRRYLHILTVNFFIV